VDAQQKNNPGTAAVLSFIFSGIGQLYNGEIAKGLWVVFFSVVSLLAFAGGAILIGFAFLGKRIFPAQLLSGAAIMLASLTAICILGIYSIVDAYQSANKK
jgi:TM2 domain-containing membrane protein YozV